MKNDDWKLSRQIEEKYRNSLNGLMSTILRNVKKMTSPEEINIYLQGVSNLKSFQNLTHNMAARFATMAEEINAKTWRQAARTVSKSKVIYEALREDINNTPMGNIVKNIIKDNSKLIRTLPSDLAMYASKLVAQKTWQGLRSSEIAKELHGVIAGHAKARANLIARTEASKAMCGLTQARAQHLGTDWYIWKTANDGLRVRPGHRHMYNVICSYNDPPAPEELIGQKSQGHYNAGNIYNCRCYSRPLLDFRNISWPARVYSNGQIKAMTLDEFKRLSGCIGNSPIKTEKQYTKPPENGTIKSKTSGQEAKEMKKEKKPIHLSAHVRDKRTKEYSIIEYDTYYTKDAFRKDLVANGYTVIRISNNQDLAAMQLGYASLAEMKDKTLMQMYKDNPELWSNELERIENIEKITL